MAEDEIISVVLEGFTDVKKLLSDTEDLEKCLKENNSNSLDLLNESRGFVDQLYKLATDIKINFYDKCKLEADEGKTVSEKNSSESIGEIPELVPEDTINSRGKYLKKKKNKNKEKCAGSVTDQDKNTEEIESPQKELNGVDLDKTQDCNKDSTESDGKLHKDGVDLDKTQECNKDSTESDGKLHKDGVDLDKTQECNKDSTESDGKLHKDGVDLAKPQECNKDSTESDGKLHKDGVNLDKTHDCNKHSTESDCKLHNNENGALESEDAAVAEHKDREICSEVDKLTKNDNSIVDSTELGIDGNDNLNVNEDDLEVDAVSNENAGNKSKSKDAIDDNEETTSSDLPASSPEDGNLHAVVKTEDENNIQRKSLIRLVDLSKLMNPMHKKSVTFDSSVIVLTSSDEETSSNPPVASKNRKSKAVDISLKDGEEDKEEKIEEKEENIEETESKDNSRKSRRLLKKVDEHTNRLESYRKIFKNSSNKSSRKPSKKNSNSGSEDDAKQSSNKTRKKTNKDGDSKRTTRKSKKTSDSNSEEDMPVKGPRKKSKKHSDNDSEEDIPKTSKKFQEISKKPKKSSDTDSEDDDIKTKSEVSEKNVSTVPDYKSMDNKFEKRVSVPLPLIPCDKLKEFYMRNIDLLRVDTSNIKRTRPTELVSKNTRNKRRRTSSITKETNNGNSSDSDHSIVDNSNDKDMSSDLEVSKENDNSDKNKNKSDNSEKEVTVKIEKEISIKVINETNKNSGIESHTQSSEKDQTESDKIHNISSDSDDDFKSFAEKREITRRKLLRKNKKNVVISDSDEETTKNDKQNKVSISSSSSGSSDDEDTKISKKTKKNAKKSSDSDSDDEKPKKGKGSSDSEEEEKVKKITKKKNAKNSSDSDSDDEKPKKGKGSSDSEENSNSEEEEKVEKKRRRRIKKTNDSSSDSDDEKSTRKQIRKVLDKDSLSETTKKAEVEEKERKARIAEKQKKYNRIFEEKKDAVVEHVHLDYDEKTKEPIISIHKKIVKNLKPHQVSGIQFMYDACFESTAVAKKSPGSGCILAHCMGLGKTLQVVALSHALLTENKKTKVEKILVVCPINTVLNWKAEFKKWMPKNSEIEVYELATGKQNYERQYRVQEWHNEGGVLIMGYVMFRNLSNPTNRRLSKKMRTVFQEGLVDPGPDLVICDEGHLLKNEKTNLSIAMNRIKSARRVVLTGTPLQNNLKEYWCMVQFVKPNLLGSYKEYMNRFVNPITNGQYTDSTQHDIQLMRKRSHVLHKLLDGVVQRRDYSVLEPYLPPKYEYVIFVNLSETQIKLYKQYMEKYARKNDGSNRTSFLFTDFQELQRICTHPRVLLDKSKDRREKADEDDEEGSEGSLKDFIDDGDGSASTSSSGSDSDVSGGSQKNVKSKSRITRAGAAQRRENNEEESEPEVEEIKKEWWQEYCDGDELDNIYNSGKLSLLFSILKECEEIGDKILIFSQSLYTLNCIEYFLNLIDEATQKGDTEKLGDVKGSWSLGLDYFRIDGSSSCDNRAYWCDSFNNPNNVRARLFLISTRAGGLGINLVAANRVIIFDVSWNPSHDIQSIYRVYRFGQTKPCYVYRFVSYGTMEMKIYERQVTKQAISKRVIDEQQIDRHYNQNDLQELYKCDLEPTERPIPMVPKDVLLGEMLQKYEKTIYQYHLHQSLLENKQDECLNEDEMKAAWEEFENEKVLRKTTSNVSALFPNSNNMSAQAINAALLNIVRRDNPTWPDAQIRGIIPALVKQLQVQIQENDMSMYQRVVQEIQIMNQARLKESYYQQQMMKFYQQQVFLQKQQQSLLGNLSVTPQQLQGLYGGPGHFMNGAQPFATGPSTSSQNRQRPHQDVIELND